MQPYMEHMPPTHFWPRFWPGQSLSSQHSEQTAGLLGHFLPTMTPLVEVLGTCGGGGAAQGRARVKAVDSTRAAAAHATSGGSCGGARPSLPGCTAQGSGRGACLEEDGAVGLRVAGAVELVAHGGGAGGHAALLDAGGGVGGVVEADLAALGGAAGAGGGGARVAVGDAQLRAGALLANRVVADAALDSGVDALVAAHHVACARRGRGQGSGGGLLSSVRSPTV